MSKIRIASVLAATLFAAGLAAAPAAFAADSMGMGKDKDENGMMAKPAGNMAHDGMSKDAKMKNCPKDKDGMAKDCDADKGGMDHGAMDHDAMSGPMTHDGMSKPAH